MDRTETKGGRSHPSYEAKGKRGKGGKKGKGDQRYGADANTREKGKNNKSGKGQTKGKGKGKGMCWDGASCTRPDCRFAHDTDRTAKATPAAVCQQFEEVYVDINGNFIEYDGPDAEAYHPVLGEHNTSDSDSSGPPGLISRSSGHSSSSESDIDEQHPEDDALEWPQQRPPPPGLPILHVYGPHREYRYWIPDPLPHLPLLEGNHSVENETRTRNNIVARDDDWVWDAAERRPVHIDYFHGDLYGKR